MFILSRKAFTLVELMIVTAVIAIILAIAVPNYLKSATTSRKTICIANLEKIDAAIDQWVLENHIPPGTALSESDEAKVYRDYVKGGKPKCPAGGTYTIHSVGDSPQVTCSNEGEGHKLP
jgi:prepilin-type N-terminal cleavage/methylation domain-containing protein